MAKRKSKDTIFELGLTRQQLVDAAIALGKTEKQAKKTNTKRLQSLITSNITGLKGKKNVLPSFSDREKRDIQKSATEWGIKDALKILTYRMDKLTGSRDETNFLRLTISRSFELFYDGNVTSAHIDELISRLPQLSSTQVDSDMINISPYYQNLYEDYAAELENVQDDA